VTSDSLGSDRLLASIRTPLIVVATVALLAGMYGRFKGLGIWPLGVDEFYISRSIDNVLRAGLPQFPCGGYYNRGILYQYLVAGVRLCGVAPELAARSIAAVSSVAVLPAVYLLGKRLRGPLAAWLAVIILCVSIWEIEMGRFARMYAPFQAVFVWYLVFYVRYTVDKHGAALAWMAALSLLGVLIWEGGVLLGIANLWAFVLARTHGRLKTEDWLRLAALLLLLVLLYLVGSNDLRGPEAPAAAAAAGEAHGPASHALQFAAAWWASLRVHPVWAGGWLLVVGLACASLPWIWSYRRRWLAAAGLCAALAAAAAHVFLLSAGIIALLLLTRLIEGGELSERRSRIFSIALAAFLVFWLAFDHWAGGLPSESVDRGAIGAAAPSIIEHLFGFPDVYEAVILPWGRVLPILSVGIGCALAFLFAQTIAAPREASNPMAPLLSLLVIMVFLIGAATTNRIETRYTFFLYPLLIVLTVAALLELMQRLPAPRCVPIALCAALLCCVLRQRRISSPSIWRPSTPPPSIIGSACRPCAPIIIIRATICAASVHGSRRTCTLAMSSSRAFRTSINTTTSLIISTSTGKIIAMTPMSVMMAVRTAGPITRCCIRRTN
jgi:hypothetical protein